MKRGKITLDREIYPRRAIDSKTVDAYKTALGAGADFPPIMVQRVTNYDSECADKEFVLLIDGAHRWTATDKGGELEVLFWKDEALDYKEVKSELLWQSYELNAKNPKNYTNEDKKVVARRVAEEYPEFTDTAVSERLGVPRTTINDWVKDIRARQNASQEATIFRLTSLGWTQKAVASIVGDTQGRISQIINSADFGKININSDKSVEEQAEYNQYDLPTAYAMAYQDADDATILKALNINIRPYDVWNFSKSNEMFGREHPGRIPGELIAHVLYFFTKRGDIVIDPMCGGGTTQDVCLVMGRKCFGYDIDLSHERKDVVEHDLLRHGWPDTVEKADLIFWDPPYFKKKEYHEDSVSRLTRAGYMGGLISALESAYARAKKGARLAFLMSDWDHPEGGPGIFIWHYANMIANAGWNLERHIQAPLSTQQVHPDIINKFREQRRLARLERYLLIGSKR